MWHPVDYRRFVAVLRNHHSGNLWWFLWWWLMLVIFGLMVVIFWMTEVINTGVGSRDAYASKNDKKGDIL